MKKRSGSARAYLARLCFGAVSLACPCRQEASAHLDTGKRNHHYGRAYDPFIDAADMCDLGKQSSLPATWVAGMSMEACVARPVSEAEAANNADAKAALGKGRDRLREARTWGGKKVMELRDVGLMMKGQDFHIGRLFCSISRAKY